MTDTSHSTGLIVRHLGTASYNLVWDSMKNHIQHRDENSADEIWSLQHEPVFTLGQAGKEVHVLDPGSIPVIKTDRGGQVTYHGPGQLVIYLLLNMKRNQLGARKLVDHIEQSIIELLAGFGITAVSRKDAPGVYVDDRKIAALGLRIRKGCSYHGLSLNVDMDLEPFSRINPCGYEGMQVTQMADLLDAPGTDLFTRVEDQLLRVLQKNLL